MVPLALIGLGYSASERISFVLCTCIFPSLFIIASPLLFLTAAHRTAPYYSSISNKNLIPAIGYLYLYCTPESQPTAANAHAFAFAPPFNLGTLK
jgi:hypothetical protein